MPPKNAAGNTSSAASKVSKKTEQKKKDKVIEDKTFGLKNKKGAKQQKFIQQVEKQVKFGGNPSNRKLELDKLKGVKGEAEDDITATIFKPVMQAQKIEKGADPKSILCAFFKQGQCGKGDKCKFSHDLTIERKAEKRSLYCDIRDDEGEAKADTMDTWDDAKLKEVVEKKHGEHTKSVPTTDIICKFFLDAVEKSKYGWFWECPKGADCHYRHALPPGFMLKRDKVKDSKKDEISLEDLIERERTALSSSNLTKVTLVSFVLWKKRKLNEKKEQLKLTEDKKRDDFKAGRQVGLSGREMFTFNPAMAADGDDIEDGEATFDTRNFMNDDDEEQDSHEYKEIAFDQVWEEEEVNESGTMAESNRLDILRNETAVAAATLLADTLNGIQIDEDLFNEDELPDDEDEDTE